MSVPFGLSPFRVFAILFSEDQANRESTKERKRETIWSRLTGTPDFLVFVNQGALRPRGFPKSFCELQPCRLTRGAILC
jgi:hypothetical protein